MIVLGWVILFFVSVYSILMLIALYGFFKKQYFSDSSSVFVSVIVPCRNEEKNIPLLLKSLLNQNYPNYEIIFVDDLSTDRTTEILAEQQRIFPEKISVYKTDPALSGKKQALLLGVENAKGEIIITTDADCIHSEKWIYDLVSAFQNDKIKMTAGCVVLNNPGSIFAHIQQLDQLALTAISAGFQKAGLPVMCSGANLAFRKSAFIETGNYQSHLDEISGDDVFLMHRFVKKYGNTSIVFVTEENALVKTAPVSTISQFISQRFRWGEKSKRYKLFFPVFLAFVTASASILLLTGLLLLPVDHAHIMLLSISLGTKATIDFLLLFLTGRVLGATASLWYFFPAFLFHLLYVPGISIAALFTKKVNWK